MFTTSNLIREDTEQNLELNVQIQRLFIWLNLKWSKVGSMMDLGSPKEEDLRTTRRTILSQYPNFTIRDPPNPTNLNIYCLTVATGKYSIFSGSEIWVCLYPVKLPHSAGTWNSWDNPVIKVQNFSSRTRMWIIDASGVGSKRHNRIPRRG